MLEALACGLPVAAFPVAGPKDVVREGEVGALDWDLAKRLVDEDGVVEWLQVVLSVAAGLVALSQATGIGILIAATLYAFGKTFFWPTTLGVVDVMVGDGATVEPGDTAVFHTLLVRGDNLKVLLDTWQRQDPLQLVMADGQGLPGLIEGLEGARVGGTRVLTLPPDLAFGAQGEPGLGLPAGVDLIVVVEVVGKY